MQAVWETVYVEEGGNLAMKRLVYLAAAALVALLILVPTAVAQVESTISIEQEATQPLPASGGVGIGNPSVLLSAGALLLGSGILGYAVLRRR